MEPERFLLFTLGDELFGTPLMDVREVVGFQKVKPIPNTVPSFLGVINIRGEIVGVIDLRQRFGFPTLEGRDLAMMVFTTEAGPLAAIADSMSGVVEIDPESIDRNPPIESRLPLAFLHGVGRVKDRLVTLINLVKILETEDVRAVHVSRAAVATKGVPA
jgi:purine-binding chemotaxis protein CheW